jgi:UDP-N-acetylglucosamine 3-dehydrogenase
MTKYVGVGVIGAGDFGQLHARIYSEIEGVKIVGVADIVEAKAEKVAKMYGAEWYEDYHKLLKREDLDAVSITTTEPYHRDPAVAAAEEGKHILVEKPLATTIKDCDDIINAAQKAGVILMVGFENRFLPDYLYIKQYIQSNALGDILFVFSRKSTKKDTARMVKNRVTGKKFGSEILEEDIHDIDVVLWWVNNQVKKVYAECIAKHLVKEMPYVEDGWVVIARFENDAVAILESNWILPDNWSPWQIPSEWLKWGGDQRYEVIGTEGAVYLDHFPTRIYACDKEGWKFPFIWETYVPNMYGEIDGALKRELSHFVKCIRTGKKPIGATGEDGRKAVQLALAAIESAEKGHPILL